MLIRRVLSSDHTWPLLLHIKRSLRPIGPSSFTRHGWFSLPAIDQYSSLLPPVGVWTVSQFQCGGPSSQNPCLSSNVGDLPLRTPSHRRHGGPLPRRLPNGTRTNPLAMNLSIQCDATSYPMGYYKAFPPPIPHQRVCCSRVTHPFAGRRQVLLPALPLDLHVLSLPLAFILSQDQTLHCIFLFL